MSSKEDILRKYRANVREQFPMPDLSDLQAVHYDNPLQQFVEMSQSVGARVVPLAEGQTVEALVKTLYPDAREIASNLPEVAAMFSRLAPYCSFPLKLVLGNLWLFGPVLKLALPAISPTAAAMLKTTVAFTMSSGSQAYNVLPRTATVSANIRYIPHQGEKETLAILEKLAKKHDLKMTVVNSNDYSPSADIHGEAFAALEATIRETFPGLPAIPYVMTGATDARFYQRYFRDCVRFAPVVYGPEQMASLHAPNENLEYNSLPGAVRLYKNLIKGQKR